MRARTSIAAAVLLLLPACSQLSLGTDEDANIVRWGTSFGMCAGYCREDLVVESSEISFTRSSWQNTLPPESLEKPLSTTAWRQLIADIDVDTFRALQDVYGCPDCADGGAEYIEIQTDEFTKRVTFEYGKAPEQLQDALQQLRALRATFPVQ
jgi:hypothetical protein